MTSNQKHTPEFKANQRLLDTIDEIAEHCAAYEFVQKCPLRAYACVNALAGIDDPEAFMRDVRAFATKAHIAGNQIRVIEHLKGGA